MKSRGYLFALAALCSLMLSLTGCSKENKESTPVLKADPTVVTGVYSAGGMVQVGITSNISWEIESNSEWLVPSPASGSGSKTITVNVYKNSDITGRIGKITISPASTLEEVSPVVVSISQFGEDEMKSKSK